MKRALALIALAAALAGVSGSIAGCSSDTTTTPAESTTSSRGAAAATTHASTTAVEPSTTSTLPPGVITFDTFTRRFETLVTRQNLAGTLPLTVMPTEEVSWLSELASRFTVTEARGYRLAEGDVVILFFSTPELASDETFAIADQAITEALREKYPQSAKAIVMFEFGYIVISEHYWSELNRLAQMARNGPPVEDYIQKLERTFDTVTGRFEAWLTHENIRGSLPFSVMPADEVAWLSEGLMPVTEAKGYRLANAELVFLFYVAPLPSYDAAQAAWAALDATAKDKLAGSHRQVWTYAMQDFGCITVISEDDRQAIGTFSGWARSGGPPDW
jgi:hypothetical protein